MTAIPAPEGAAAARRRLLVTVTSLTGTLTVASAATITNVAVPAIMGAFGVGQDLAQWLATAFFAGIAAGMLTTDWLERAFGQRAVYVATMTVFALASVAGGIAESFELLVLARAVQGLTAGVMMPLNLLSMFMVFPPDRRALATGLFGISFVLGPGVGPWLGGIAIDAFDWRASFYVSLAPVAFGIVMALWVLPGRRFAGPPSRFDWLGFGLVIAALGAVLTGLSNGQLKGWGSDFVIGMLAAGCVATVVFVMQQWRAADPLLDVRLLRYRHYAAAMVLSFAMGLGLFGSLYLVPVFVQLVQGFTPTRAGLLLVPAALAMGLVSPLMGRISDHVPVRVPNVIGYGLIAVSTYALGFTDAHTAFALMAALIVLNRVGIAVAFPAQMAGGLRGLPPDRLGAANGGLNFSRQLAGALGINLLAIFLERRIAFYAEALAAAQTGANTATVELLDRVTALLAAGGLGEPLQQPAAMFYLGRVVAGQATALAFRDTFFVFGAVLALALVAVWFLRPKAPG